MLKNDVITLQTSFDDTAEKKHLSALEQRVATLRDDKDHLLKTLRTMKETLTRLEDSVGSDTAVGVGGGQILMSRSEQARGTARQNVTTELEQLKTRVDDIAQAIVNVQSELGIDTKNAPASDDNINRLQLFGQYWQQKQRK